MRVYMAIHVRQSWKAKVGSAAAFAKGFTVVARAMLVEQSVQSIGSSDLEVVVGVP